VLQDENQFVFESHLYQSKREMIDSQALRKLIN